jgi:hypothetical protein
MSSAVPVKLDKRVIHGSNQVSYAGNRACETRRHSWSEAVGRSPGRLEPCDTDRDRAPLMILRGIVRMQGDGIIMGRPQILIRAKVGEPWKLLYRVRMRAARSRQHSFTPSNGPQSGPPANDSWDKLDAADSLGTRRDTV